MAKVKLFSLKRLMGCFPFALLLMFSALLFCCGTGLVEAHSSRWDGRQVLGLIFWPAAFFPDRFENIRSGFLDPDELRWAVPLQFLYAYLLLTFTALFGAGVEKTLRTLQAPDLLIQGWRRVPRSLVLLLLTAIAWVHVDGYIRWRSAQRWLAEQRAIQAAQHEANLKQMLRNAAKRSPRTR